MITFRDYIKPENLDEAYQLLTENRRNTLLGGCGFLHLGNKRIRTAIDISGLALDFIEETDTAIEIGAMTTLRALEISPLLNKYFSGVLPASVRHIVGIQLRNLVTMGGTVYSRYGFSDLLTALLVLDAQVVLYKAGSVSLEEFLKNSIGKEQQGIGKEQQGTGKEQQGIGKEQQGTGKGQQGIGKEQQGTGKGQKVPDKEILLKIVIPKTTLKAAFQSLRNSQSDYGILNVAVSNLNEDWKIAVGARPGRAMLAPQAAQLLTGNPVTPELAEQAGLRASLELEFGTNMRGSREYRTQISRVLVARAIMEVLA